MNQANKAKRVLSANRNFHVFIDPFMGGKMINENVERTTFEELLKPHYKRFLAPIDTVLKEGNVTIGQIDSFEIIGGVTRVPKLQEILKEYYGKELGMHLNGDEAMAHGTALFAANLTRDIQVRPIWLTDVSVQSYKLRIEALTPTSDLSKSTDLFRKWAKIPSKKQISLTFSQSLKATIIAEYPTGDMPIIRYNVTGVEEFAKKYGTDPVIYMTFTLDTSGIPALTAAEARVEVVETVENKGQDEDTLNSTDTEQNNGAETDPETTLEGKTTENTEKSTENSEKTTENSEKTTENEEKPTENEEKPKESDQKAGKKKVKKLDLDLKATNIEFPSPMSIGGVRLTAARLVSLSKEDTERRKTAESRSELESFIYFLREKLEEETFIKVTTLEEREKLEKMLGGVREWLDGPNFYTATSAVVEEKKEKT